MACEKKNYEEIIAAYLAADTNNEGQHLQELSNLKLHRIILKLKKEQNESWNNVYHSGLSAIKEASPQEPFSSIHIVLTLALLAIVCGGVAVSFIGLPLFAIMASLAGVFAGLGILIMAYGVISSNTYKDEEISYIQKFIDHQLLHPDVVLAYKISSLMEYYQQNQQFLELDLSNCPLKTKSIVLIDKVMKNNAMVKIILPSLPNVQLMGYLKRYQIETSLSNIENESDINSFYGIARQFFWAEKLNSSDTSRLPLDFFKLILHNLSAVFHISDGASIPKWNLFQPLPKSLIADSKNKKEEQPLNENGKKAVNNSIIFGVAV